MKSFLTFNFLVLALAPFIAGCLDASDNSSKSGVVQVSSDQGSVVPKGRSVIVLLDGSESFSKMLGDAMVQVDRITDALGPRDRITIILVAGEFRALQDVLVYEFPPVASDIFLPAKSFPEWFEKQAALLRAKRRVEDDKARLRLDLLEFVKRGEGESKTTDVWSALRYISAELRVGDTTHLFILSDLKQAAHGVSTQLPPEGSWNFENMNVHVLFVPDIWQREDIKKEWIAFFQRSGAASVEIVEAAQSRARRDLLPKSDLPEVVRKSFLD